MRVLCILILIMVSSMNVFADEGQRDQNIVLKDQAVILNGLPKVPKQWKPPRLPKFVQTIPPWRVDPDGVVIDRQKYFIKIWPPSTVTKKFRMPFEKER